MKLCSACHACIVGQSNRLERGRFIGCVRHHDSIDAFIAGVNSGCNPCSLLWHNLENSGHDKQKLDSALRSSNGTFARQSNEPISVCAIQTEDGAIMFWVRLEESAVARLLGCSTKLNDTPLHEAIRLSFVPTSSLQSIEGSDSKDTSRNLASDTDRAKQWNTGDARSLQLAASWMEECQSHPDCTGDASGDDWIPTRLIDVGAPLGSGRCRVVVTAEANVTSPYCTLSHRWGGMQFMQLTRSNLLSMREEGFDCSQLPQTFQDAIAVCRSLNVRYLWIDSLCILQDDKQDWAEQSGQMCLVYANGRCNIAADAIHNSGESMFRESQTEWPTRLQHTVSDSKEEGVPDGSYDVIDFWFWKDQVHDSLLNQRAWVFQERLMSPRTLHFTHEQIMWECRTMAASPAYPCGIPIDALQDADTKSLDYFRNDDRSGTSPGPCHSREHCDFCRQWGLWIATFSNCSVTYSDDRPMAIAGLADLIERLSGDRFMAGLWKKHLHRQLGWRALSIRGADVDARKRDIPSWSWLSLSSGIFGNLAESPVEWLCELLDCEVGKIQVSNIGIQQAGRIKLRGSLTRINIRPYIEDGEKGHFWTVSLTTDAESESDRSFLAWPDWGRADLPTSSTEREHFVMPLGVSKGLRLEHSALILEKIHAGHETFRRVGYCNGAPFASESLIGKVRGELFEQASRVHEAREGTTIFLV